MGERELVCCRYGRGVVGGDGGFRVRGLFRCPRHGSSRVQAADLFVVVVVVFGLWCVVVCVLADGVCVFLVWWWWCRPC